MEKYGVQEDPAKTGEKTAESEPTHCPTCGSPLDKLSNTGVLKCPECGTKPFEKRK